tara:strand:- start:168 stop:794 length:627 start_codon:yes stop_codon:yes gene_type:complete
MTNQKSFNYQFKVNFNELDFFVNKTNFNAFNNIISDNLNLIFLYGPNKSGKSFLAHIWKKNNYAIQLENNFKIFLDKKSNVLIDNISKYKEEDVFYIVNNCILNKLKILITSNSKINEIDFQFLDLSSRLKTFNYLEINQPNDEMLLTILTKLLIDKQFIINSNDIFEYILRRVDRSYEGIHNIVAKLDILTLEKKRQLTIPLIKEIL